MAVGNETRSVQMASAVEKIEAACSGCGAAFRVPATAVGRKARCPKCQTVFQVAEPALADDVEDDGDDLLAALGDGETTEAASPGEAGQRLCPSCHAELATDARLCTSCGLDTRTGRTRQGAGSTDAPAVGAALTGGLAALAGAGGGITLGTTLAIVGATVGAAIWFGVALATDYEIGWIAWGIGALAGGGMALGMRGGSPVGGGVAAIVAVGGILLGKVVVFSWVFGTADDWGAPMAVAEGTRASLVEHYVIVGFANSTLSAEASDAEWEAEEERIMRTAQQRVDAMSDAEFEEAVVEAQRDALARELAFASVADTSFADPQFEARFDAAYQEGLTETARVPADELPARIVAVAQSSANSASSNWGASFVAWSFGWMDLLFFGLAIFTAFKLGSGVGRA